MAVTPTKKAIDYRPVLRDIADAILFHALVNEEGNTLMANNFERLSAAVAAVADGVLAVAEAIRNPAVNKNDQAVIDALAGSLESAAAGLAAAVVAENEEDAGPTPDPVPETPAE